SVDRYFGALVRSALADYRARRAVRNADRALDASLQAQKHEARERRNAHLADPIRWLRGALDLLAMQWLPRERTLLFDGNGLGLAWTRDALTRLLAVHAAATCDLVTGVLDDFRRAGAHTLGDDGYAAIANIVERELALIQARRPPLADDAEG